MIKLGAVAAASVSTVIVSVIVCAPARSQPDSCPDIHVVAVEPTSRPTVDSPTAQDTGELAAVIVPVLNAAQSQGYEVERTYVPYPADTAGQGFRPHTSPRCSTGTGAPPRSRPGCSPSARAPG